MSWVRKVMLGFLVTSSAVACFWTWLLIYRVSDPAKAQRIYTETRERLRQREAVNPSDNGWKLLSTELRSNKQFLRDLCERNELEPRDVKQLGQILPVLEAVVERPTFGIPAGSDTLFIETRDLFRGLHLLTRFEVREGNPREGLRTALLSFALASRMRRQGPLIQGMVTCMAETLALSSLNVALLETLDPTEYQRVLVAVPPGDPSELLPVADEEFVWQMDFSGDAGLLQPYRALSHFPGYAERERKVAQELYLLARPGLENGQETPNLEQSCARRTPWLSTLEGGLNWNAVTRQYQAVWTRREGIRTLAALQLYRATRGELPDSLDRLSPWPLEQAPRDWLAPGGRFEYKPDFQLRSLHQAANVPVLEFAPKPLSWE